MSDSFNPSASRTIPTGATTKPMLRALHGETLVTPPIWLMRQAGRYLPEYRALRETVPRFLDLCLTPELAAEATLQPIRRFAFDAAILFSDILIVPYGLGQALDYREGEGPVLEPVRSLADLGRLDDSDFVSRVRPVWQTVERVKTLLSDETALIGFAGAPWTVASYMVEGRTSRDFVATKSWAFGDADGFQHLIDHLMSATITYLDGQVRAGAEIIQLFDSWSGVLPEAAFRRWVIEPTKRIVEALHQSHPGLPIIGFPRGAGLMYRTYFAETGVTAVGLDYTVPLGIAHRAIQPLGPVQGNLDPVLLLAGGDAMSESIEQIVASLGSGPFIFNLGHGVLPATPLGHVQALVEQIHLRVS